MENKVDVPEHLRLEVEPESENYTLDELRADNKIIKDRIEKFSRPSHEGKKTILSGWAQAFVAVIILVGMKKSPDFAAWVNSNLEYVAGTLFGGGALTHYFRSIAKKFKDEVSEEATK